VQSRTTHAVSALGWDGIVVRAVAVLGQRVSAVVRLRADVHRWRTQNGWPPMVDQSWFRSWFTPACHETLPIAAVDLVGLLIDAPTPELALDSCGTLMTLAPCAVLVPELGEDPVDGGPPGAAPEQSPDPLSLIELDYYGVGLLTCAGDDAVTVWVAPENRTGEFGASPFSRWLLEVLYDRLVDQRRPRVDSAVPDLHGPGLLAPRNGADQLP